MKILIIGGGSIGFLTAEYFMRGGHDVTVVESDPDRVKLLQEQLDVNVMVGRGSDFMVLKDAGIEKAKLFLALTDEDEINIIACVYAKNVGVPVKMARLSETIHLPKDSIQALKTVGVDEILDTEQLLIQEISKLVSMPGAADIKYFMDGEYSFAIFSFNRSSVFYGKKISEIKISVPFTPIGFIRTANFEHYHDDVVINEYLYLYVGCKTSDLQKLHKELMPESREIRRVMIYGAGYKSKDTNLALTSALKESGVKDVKLVLDNKEIADWQSGVTDTPIVLGDPSSPLFARREQLSNEDVFIAISDNYEKNLFSCSMAFNANVPYTISLVRHPEHVNFVTAVPLTSFINPAMIAANKITKFSYAENIMERAIVDYNQVECLEFMVGKNSWVDGKKIKQFPIAAKHVIAVRRRGQFLDINDDTVIKASDRVLVYLTYDELDSIKKFVA